MRYHLHVVYSNGTDDFDYWDNIVTYDFESDSKKDVYDKARRFDSVNTDTFVITDKETRKVWTESELKDFIGEEPNLRTIVLKLQRTSETFFPEKSPDVIKSMQYAAEEYTTKADEAKDTDTAHFLRHCSQLLSMLRDVEEEYDCLKDEK